MAYFKMHCTGSLILLMLFMFVVLIPNISVLFLLCYLLLLSLPKSNLYETL